MGRPGAVFLMLGLGLAGCGPSPEPIPPPPPPPPSPSPPPIPPAYVPVARLISTGPFVSEGGGYAVVLLKQGTTARNRQACATMVGSMSTRLGPADGRPIVEDGQLVYERPVYWPVTGPTAINCTTMIQNYNFTRAAANLQRIPNWSSLGQGPFVIVRKQNGSQAGLFDFSNIAGADFADQFRAVVNYMSQRTDVWSPGFYQQATLRQRLRYYVKEQSGGATIVVARLVNLAGGHASG